MIDGGPQPLPRNIRFVAIIKSVAVLCVLGAIPGGWLVTLPLFTVYATLHFSAIKNAVFPYFVIIRNIISPFTPQFIKNATDAGLHSVEGFIPNVVRREAQRFFLTLEEVEAQIAEPEIQNPPQPYFHRLERLGELLGLTVTSYRWTIAKLLMAFVTSFTIPMPYSFLAIYGMYRFTYEEWVWFFREIPKGFYYFVLGFFGTTYRDADFYKRFLTGVIFSFCFAAMTYFYGIAILLDFGLSSLQALLFSIGVCAFFRDLRDAFHTPFQTLTQKTGVLYGSYLGRWLAYKIISGRIEGSLGPAVGVVESTDFLSQITTPFLSPATTKFTDSTLFGRFLHSRFFNFLNSIWTSVFFTENMRIQGDFYGTVGPTHFQLYLCMVGGGIIGYLVDKGVDRLYQHAAENPRMTEVYLPQLLDLAYAARWHLGYMAIATPLIVLSNAGVPIIAFVGGSVVVALFLTGGAILATFGGLYGVTHLFNAWRQGEFAAEQGFSPIVITKDYPLERRFSFLPQFKERLERISHLNATNQTINNPIHSQQPLTSRLKIVR